MPLLRGSTVYPSGCVAPSSYPQIKAHKENKSARNIIAHTDCPQEALSSFVIPIVRPVLKDSPFSCKNSSDFVKGIKDFKLDPDEI